MKTCWWKYAYDTVSICDTESKMKMENISIFMNFKSVIFYKAGMFKLCRVWKDSGKEDFT